MGNGRVAITNVTIAEELGVDEKSVRKTWNHRLDVYYRLISGYESDIFNHLNTTCSSS